MKKHHLLIIENYRFNKLCTFSKNLIINGILISINNKYNKWIFVIFQ